MQKTYHFGQRLAELRKMKGCTQVELAQSTGISQRMIVYYEREAKRPPLEKLEAIAQVLKVSMEELLGIKATPKQPGAPKDAYLNRKLQIVTQLPKNDQKAIVTMIEALANKKGAA